MGKIPKKIYQTWETKVLPIRMKNCVEKLKQDNPEFKHFLFDKEDCEEYIKKYFSNFKGVNVFKAYKNLIPGAFKADLWRYCVLYREGGVYLDIKYECINGFKFINFINKNYFSRDRNNGIYNAIIIVKSKNKELKNAILKTVQNINNKYYGNDSLSITGPLLLKNIINNDIEFYFESYNNIIIIKQYDGYREDQKKYLDLPHYSILWNNSCIYYNDIYKSKIIFSICLKNKIGHINIKKIKSLYQNYKFNYYNYNDCYKFIKKYYSKKIFNLWNNIINKKLKKLFTIICILYKKGGIYISNNLLLKNNLEKKINKNYLNYILNFPLNTLNIFFDIKNIDDKILISKKNTPNLKSLIKTIYLINDFISE